MTAGTVPWIDLRPGEDAAAQLARLRRAAGLEIGGT